MEEQKSKRSAYLTNVAIALAIGCLSAVLFRIGNATDALSVVKILSDSCLLPGVLLSGMSVLGWIGSKGTYDIFGYTGHSFLAMFKRDSYFAKESYYDYCSRKNTERKPFNLPRLIVGVAFILLGVALTVVYLLIES